MIRLERQDIGIGGLMGGMVNGMLIRYPASIEKSIYATVEPFSYQVRTVRYNHTIKLVVGLLLKNYIVFLLIRFGSE